MLKFKAFFCFVINHFLSFTPSAQKGILLLFFLLIGIWTVRFISFQKDSEIQVHILESYLDTEKAKPRLHSSSQREKNPKSLWNLHTFDPNFTKAVEFKNMGFSRTFISNWFAQKTQVGFVKTVADFNAIATLTTDEKNIVTPFLDFSKYKKPETTQQQRAKPIFPININTADRSQLQSLPGVGKVLSSRIVGYRNQLGGYASIAQIKEVYGISSELALQIDSVLESKSLNQTNNKLAKIRYNLYKY